MCINSTCSYQLLGNEYIIIEWNEKGYYLRFEKNIVVCVFIVPKSWLNFNRLISKLPINHSGHMCFYSISHIFSCSMPHHFHWKYCGERKLASRDVFVFIVPKTWLNLMVKRKRSIFNLAKNDSSSLCFYAISHIFSYWMPYQFFGKISGERKLELFVFLLCQKLVWICELNEKD